MFLNSLLVCFSLVSGISSSYVLTKEEEHVEKVEVVETRNPYENAVIYYDSELDAIFSNFKRINSEESSTENFQTFIIKK